MFYGGSDRPDKGREDGQMLMLHCFGAPLLYHFLARERLFNGIFLSGFVRGVERSLLELSVWTAMAWAGYTKVGKMATSLHFFALLLWQEFSELFFNVLGLL